MKITVDVMGGDNAPNAPVEGALTFSRERSDIEVILVGDEAKIKSLQSAPWYGSLPANVRIVHTTTYIESGEEPVRAVRRKKDSSMVMAARMVKDGEADAMLSAGNTGAIVASGLLVIGRQQGIDRPALAPVLPTFDGKGVLLLDAGATMDAESKHLVQFAEMGSAYSKYVLGIEHPRVGLVNVGSEEGKGNAVTKETYDLLKAANLNFVGNVEARELLNGVVDVAVCDGFVGNVILKLTEGVGLGIFGALKQALTQTFLAKLAAGILKPSLRAFRNKFDYAEYGGAPFLGVAGGCFKAHGSSNARAWYMACTQAARFVEQDMTHKLSSDLGVEQTQQ